MLQNRIFFGWYLHLVYDANGILIAFELNPVKWHVHVPVQCLLTNLLASSTIVTDKGYIYYPDELLVYLYGQVRLVAKRGRNMRGDKSR